MFASSDYDLTTELGSERLAYPKLKIHVGLVTNLKRQTPSSLRDVPPKDKILNPDEDGSLLDIDMSLYILYISEGGHCQQSYSL
jgi:hypothetical protein